MPWKKARKLIKEDPRYKNFGDSDHVSEHNLVKRVSLISSLPALRHQKLVEI